MKDIKGYEGLYGITSCGKVWSYKSQKFLSPADNGHGYQLVCLSKDGKQKTYTVHRLVAQAYIPNPDGLPQINHLDENKENNCVSNLCWSTIKDNINYGTRTERAKANGLGRPTKKIYCVELDRIFDSLKTASKELDINIGNLSSALTGRHITCGGYHWEYAD